MGKYAGCTSPSSSAWIKFALLGIVISVLSQGISCETELTESQCRPYIEKALKEQHIEQEERAKQEDGSDVLGEQEDSPPTDEITDSIEDTVSTNKQDSEENEAETKDNDDEDDEGDVKSEDEDGESDDDDKNDKGDQDLSVEEDTTKEDETDTDDNTEKREVGDDSEKDTNEETEQDDTDMDEEKEDEEDDNLDTPIEVEVKEVEIDDDDDDEPEDIKKKDEDEEAQEAHLENEALKNDVDDDKEHDNEDDKDAAEDDKEDEKDEEDDNSKDEKEESIEEQIEEKSMEIKEEEDQDDDDQKKVDEESKEDQTDLENKDDKEDEEKEDDEKDEGKGDEEKDEEKGDKEKDEEKGDDEKEEDSEEKIESIKKTVQQSEAEISGAESEEAEDLKEDSGQENVPEEEELIKEVVIPENLRPREHIDKILKLDDDSGLETILEKTIDTTLKTLKSLYDNGIKPLEMLYKYRDLSNRHFGDPEIFSKPLILFMGPWSGGKSSTINYLLDNEYSHTSLRTGAEPSPAYFNILMHGEKEEVLDGTQLAADWTFSGLQKFGQGLLDRLKGIKLPSKLLEKVNIVEIPGILEIRKQVQRLFPFNDACQWFIDRADIIFLVYDPSKLDVGPETEAILDQLKGREYQTRIILNKADQVKPEELMRVQGTLIWNISPLMSSSEPPIMYSTSLWSLPYEAGAPTRLLQAQERAFLRDLSDAIDKRVENKISSARRFAVRVRNHAKMVDCYLTTYYNHKTFFGNRKKISDDIIENPQKYHIYEGLSTLTNISRYDLPDPDVYKDFFKINPLYDFQRLSETCTYFRGCPINKLDVVIAYDLPELIGKYRKEVETAKEKLEKENT